MNFNLTKKPTLNKENQQEIVEDSKVKELRRRFENLNVNFQKKKKQLVFNQNKNLKEIEEMLLEYHKNPQLDELLMKVEGTEKMSEEQS